MTSAPPNAFKVNLGDLPSWLGLIAASVAAAFVYLQLRSQQKEIARQIAALERQQADQIVIEPDPRVQVATRIGWGPEPDALTNKFCWAVGVTNTSTRPIRAVQCRISPDRQQAWKPAVKGGAARRADPTPADRGVIGASGARRPQ